MSAVLEDFSILTPEEVRETWPYVEGGIARALSTSDGEATVEDTLTGLLAGRTKLALFQRGGSLLGVVFQILAFPRYKIARILLAFGRDMQGVREAVERAEAWAKAQGCRYTEGWVATAARARLFGRYGYTPRYLIVRKKL